MRSNKAALAAQIQALQAQLEAEDESGVYEEPNGFWRIVLRDPNGRQTSRRRAPDGSRLASREQAVIAKGQWETALASRTLVIGRERFDALWPGYQRAAKAEMTAGAWADLRTHGTKRLLPYLGETQVNRWSYAVIEHWRGDMYELVEAGDLAPKTANNARIALMGFCKWAVRNGEMAFNPVAEVAPLRVDDVERPYLQLRQINRYFDGCSPTYLPLARTLVGTGARISEAIAFKVGDFDALAGTLTVNRQLARDTTDTITTKETKGKKRRVVYIGSDLVAVLQDMLAVRREHGIEDDGWLFLVPPPRRGRYATRTEPRPRTARRFMTGTNTRCRTPASRTSRCTGSDIPRPRRGCRPVARSSSFERSSVTRP